MSYDSRNPFAFTIYLETLSLSHCVTWGFGFSLLKILSGFLNWNLNHQTCERNCLVKRMEIENEENLREFSMEIIHISTVIMYRVRNKKLLWIFFSCLSRSKHFSEFNGEKVELGIWKYTFFFLFNWVFIISPRWVFLQWSKQNGSSNLLEDSSRVNEMVISLSCTSILVSTI